MIDVQAPAGIKGSYLRRLHSVTAIPGGFQATVELINFADMGDQRKPIIVSEEPLAHQTIFTNTPNRPQDATEPAPRPLSPPAIPPSALTTLEVTALDAHIVRLRLGTTAALAQPRDFGILAPGALETLTPLPAELREDEAGATLTAGPLTVHLARDPLAIQLGPLRTALDDRNVHGLLCTPPPGFVAGERGPEAFWSWALTPDEHLYGLGERFTRLDHRGEQLTLWNIDAWGTTTAASYKNVPFLHSSQGYGLFFHTAAPVELNLGNPSQRAARAHVGEAVLDCFIILGSDARELLQHYTRLTGRATMPPRWALGVWLSRCRYQTRDEVETVAARARAEAIPADVLHIDPAWLAQPGLNCDFQVNETAFPDLPGMISQLRDQGFKVSLWELPYISIKSPLYAEAAALGYFLKDGQGAPIPADFGGPTPDGQPRLVLDFTNPAAKSWWQDLHRPLLRAGVEVFKTDFGEGVPLGANAHNGMTGYELRNLLPLLYNAAVHEVITAEKGRPGMVWGRSGWAGTQRYPAQWGGDPKTDAWSMQGSLRGGLNMAMSAPGIWAHDIGGFYGPPPTPTLYARWAAFGLLSPLARAHGTTPREPWEFGPEALATFRHFARLRMRLNQYLYDAAWEAHTQGMPMLRPLALEFPDDSNAATLDDQYLLGHDLLVAPIFDETPGPRPRQVYIPQGFVPVVLHHDTLVADEAALATPQRDRTWQVFAAEEIVTLLRRDSLIPLAPVREYLGEDPPDEITLLCGGGEATTTLHWDVTGAATSVTLLVNSTGQPVVQIAGDHEVLWRVQDLTGQVTELGRCASGAFVVTGR